MGRARGLWIALLLLGGCNREEIKKLTEQQHQLEHVLSQRKDAAAHFAQIKQRKEQLEQSVVHILQADLGPDPQARLQSAMPPGTQVTAHPDGSYDLAGPSKPRDLLGPLAGLAHNQPGLILSHLAFTPAGFTARLRSPAPVVPVAPRVPPTTVPAPILPPESFWESSEAKDLRAKIAATYEEVGKLGADLAEMAEDQQIATRDSTLLHDADTGARLPNAVEAAGMFFGGEHPWFPEGTLEIQGNDLTLTGPDPGADVERDRELQLLHQHLSVSHSEHSPGHVVLHVNRLAASGINPGALAPPPPWRIH